MNPDIVFLICRAPPPSPPPHPHLPPPIPPPRPKLESFLTSAPLSLKGGGERDVGEGKEEKNKERKGTRRMREGKEQGE